MENHCQCIATASGSAPARISELHWQFTIYRGGAAVH
jgi:hypothetical protein